MVIEWKHYPNSPWGDIDICPHGVTREHGDDTPRCIICDYSKDDNIELLRCKICKAMTYHLDKKCLRCGSETNI